MAVIEARPETQKMNYDPQEMYPNNVQVIRNFQGQSLVTSAQFDRTSLELFCDRVDELERLFDRSDRAARAELGSRCQYVVLGSAFYQKSTRSRLSFEVAMHRLGGGVVTETADSAKDSDTNHSMRVISGQSQSLKGVDVIAFRHAQAGMAVDVLPYVTVPLLNAGDGNREHILQGLKEYSLLPRLLSDGRSTKPDEIDNHEFTFYGDNLNSRTNHSLVRFLMEHGQSIKINFVSPPPLQVPDKVVRMLEANGVTVGTYNNLRELDANGGPGDVLSVLRPQDNLLTDEAMKYAIMHDPEFKFAPVTPEWMEKYPRLKATHPMPIYEEIPRRADFHPQFRHFQLSDHGFVTAAAMIDLTVNG